MLIYNNVLPNLLFIILIISIFCYTDTSTAQMAEHTLHNNNENILA